MRRFMKAVLPMAAVAVATYFLMAIILSNILFTAACALVGQKLAQLPYILSILAVYAAAQLIAHRVRKLRDSEERREYLAVLGSDVYDRRADRRLVSRDGLYRAELVAYALVCLVQCATTFGVLSAVLVAPILYAIFHVYNRRLWLSLHKTWANERMRLNPNP